MIARVAIALGVWRRFRRCGEKLTAGCETSTERCDEGEYAYSRGIPAA